MLYLDGPPFTGERARGTVGAGSSWAPTLLSLAHGVTEVNGNSTSHAIVASRLNPVGAGARRQIDNRCLSAVVRASH